MLPHSAESEMAVLGAMILDPKVIPDTLAILPSDSMFYREANAAVYRALVEVWRRTGGIDLVQLVAALEASGTLADVGGTGYLLRLSESTPAASSAPHYAQIVLDRYRLRKLVEATEAIAHDARQNESSEALIGRAMGAIGEIASGLSIGKDPGDYWKCAEDVLAEIQSGIPAVYPTGFYPFDSIVGGLLKCGLIYLMGEPGSGKSSLVDQLAYCVCAMHNIRGVKFGFEVQKRATARNLLSADSMVPLNHMANTGETFKSATALGRVRQAIERAKSVQLEFVDEDLTMESLEARADSLAAKGMKLMVVDYIQNVPVDGKFKDEHLKIAHVCRRLQRIKVKYGISIIAVSQMTKSSTAEARPPKKSDCYGSAAIDQTSDMTIAVYRPNYNKPMEASDTHTQYQEKQAESYLYVLKAKTNTNGVNPMHFHGPCLRFFEPGRVHDGPLVDSAQSTLDQYIQPSAQTPVDDDEEVPF